jgi:integrase
MSLFRRGKYWSLYVPRESGGVVQRSTGTTDAKLAAKMGRMVDQLADVRRWDVLQAIDAKRVTVAQCYDAFVYNRLDALLADASAESLSVWVDQWVKTLAQSARTQTGYTQKIRAMIPDGMKSSALTAGWITDTIAALPHSPGTKKQYLHVLSLFVDYLVGHRVMPLNPIHQRGLVRRPKNNKPRKVWKTEAEDRRLVDCAPSPFREYFALVHASGAERDAALAMTRRDVDTATWLLHIPGTKTETRDRTGVPLETWARAILRPFLKGLLPDAPLFPGLSRRAVNVAHQEARTAAKLPGYQLRDARHSYAIRALLRGEPLWKVSKWLGHSNMAITAKVYTQFDLDDALAASTELNRHATPHATSGGFSS